MKDEHWKIEAYHAARKALKRHVVPFVAEKLRADVEAVIGPANDGRIAYMQIAKEITQRSPQQVARLERARGLRK